MLGTDAVKLRRLHTAELYTYYYFFKIQLNSTFFNFTSLRKLFLKSNSEVCQIRKNNTHTLLCLVK